ncbi:MAG: hypothetical protein ALECFALPRED_001813 [Alectoria fallacina]|uniref:F-box domain-containing protein n=1 Tax=Alectoria fallacina TaxID=1903189 RepID=A0A8H3IHX4_9LECA|nr:MAG: hypothetical protein ALECFALPRED_001813 [Alectoria fallacina]
MCTRGYSIIRYRGRYYCFYIGTDSMPDDLGTRIVNEIPEDPQAYQAWLATKRAKAAKWDKAVQDSLKVKRDYINNGEDEDCSQGSEISSNKFSPWQLHGPDVDRFPSYVPWFNDTFNEWVYVVDLDREVFTVDHAVHFKLDKIPRHDWANALGFSDSGERILLPCFVPEESITDLLLRLDPPAAENLRMYTDLNAKMVTAKDINDFPPSLRHGPILYARIFQMYQRQQKLVLSHLLLGWEPSELHFREMVYAILCLASAGSSAVELVYSQNLREGEGHAFLSKGVETEATTEFLAHLGIGGHLEGNEPGSAPEGLMYWFQGALVLVTAHLNHPGVLEESVAQVASYCRAKHPGKSVNAIVISIEHVVLVRVYADGRVDHTRMMSLFALQTHYSKDTRERYSPLAIEEKEREAKESLAILEAKTRRQKVRKMRQQGIDGGEESDEHRSRDDKAILDRYHPASIFNSANNAVDRYLGRDMVATEPTFMALVSLLDATARQRLPKSNPVEGRLPTEIYRSMIANIVDFETYCACKMVSRNFRDLCQENLRIGNNAVTVIPNPDTRSYTHAPEPIDDDTPIDGDINTSIRQRFGTRRGERPSQPPTFRVVQDSTGLSQDFPLGAGRTGSWQHVIDEATWQIIVGSEPGRRSMICGLEVAFRPAPR